MPERLRFPDREALAEALADRVVADLAAGIAERGAGALAVSGGSTPAKFFAVLAQRGDLDWPRVVVTLVDERWVDDTSDRSNARLAQDRLLKGPAASARFVPLYTGGAEPDAGHLALTNAAAASVPQPFDSVVLGMGGDGHTASFFPGSETLGAALTGTGPVVATSAPGAGEPRVTWTLPRLLDTRGLYLHIEGEEKAKVLDLALADGPVVDMPVRTVLRQTRTPITVFWSP